MDEDYIYLVHHGVPGMKWGVRKKKPTSSSSTRKKKNVVQKKIAEVKKSRRIKKADKKREKKNKEAKKKSIYSMTDSELDKHISRLNKEKTARQLELDRMSTGKKIVRDIAIQSATRIGTQAAYQIGMHYIGKNANKMLGAEVFQDKKKKQTVTVSKKKAK